MWAELVRALGGFPDAVLTWLDDSGCPVAVRCRPGLDHDRQVVKFCETLPLSPRPGLASLLCHSHDARLWQLRSFLVKGRLDDVDGSWVFPPTALVPGTGMSGLLGDLQAFIAARKRAGRYLSRRGLSRPVIPWERLR